MKTIFKNMTDLVAKIGLSQSEFAIIKKVSIISLLLCFLSVAGIWGYFKFTTHSSLPEITKKIQKPIVSATTGILIDIQAHLLIAESYLQRGKPIESIPYLERALQLSTDNVRTRYLLAQAQLEAGMYEQSLAQISELDQIEIPDSLKESFCVISAMSLFYSGKIIESTRKLNDCLSSYPGSAKALCFMGIVKTFNVIDSSDAHRYFEEAIKKDSSYVEAWYQLGRLEMVQGDTFQARKHLLYALELDPLHVKSHARLGMLYYYMGNYTLAENCYRTTLALNPGDYNTRYNLGELLYVKGDTINALKEFTLVLQSKPEHCDANFRVGLISMRNNMYKEAISYFETALQKEPDNIRIILQMAVSYEKIGLFSDALMIYKRILSIDDLNPIAQQKIKMISQQLTNSEPRK
jgi:tetratricopeptide (TPR) repeat protein